MFGTGCPFSMCVRMSSTKIYLINIFPRVKIMDDPYVTGVIHVRILGEF